MKYVTIAFILIASAISGNAQISFSADEFFAALSHQPATQASFFSTDLTGLDALIAKSGAGMSWDIGNRTYTQDPVSTDNITILTYPGGAALANDSDFLQSTHVIKRVPIDPKKPVQYEFIKIDQTGYWLMGASQVDSMGKATKTSGYSPPQQEMKFPLTYQTAWNSISTIHSPNTPPNNTVTNGIDAVVDAYGTLTTPTSAHKNGNSSPMALGEALRIKIKNTSTVTIKIGGVSQTLLNDVNYTYQYYTKSGRGATIAADTNMHALDVSYSVQGSNSVTDNYSSPEDLLKLYLSVNPASHSETKFYFSMKHEGNAQISLMDNLGREVHRLFSGHAEGGQNIIPIDPAKLSTGTYFIRVNADGITAMRKLVVLK